MRTAVPRLLIRASIIACALVQVTPVVAGPPIDLPALPIVYDYGPPLESHGYWVGTPSGGEWEIMDGGLDEGGKLTLEVEIRPPPISVPLEAGPAILFGRVSLHGGIGDVGAGARVRRVVARALPACTDPTDCAFHGAITLPTQRLPSLAEKHRAETWNAAFIDLTLVRTFAQGTWLQVLPLFDELEDMSGGTVGKPRHMSSRMLVLGAAPVGPRGLWRRADRAVLERIDRLRERIGDPSHLPETQPLLIDIETAPCSWGWTMATATGDTLVDVSRPGASVPVRVEAPLGATWIVSVPSIDRAQGTGIRPRAFGPFTSDGPGLVSGRVAWDPYYCVGVEPGSVAWRVASPDDLASFAEAEPEVVLDTYSTLPLPDGRPAREASESP